MVRRDEATVEFQAQTEAWVDISSHNLPSQDRYSCSNDAVEDLIELNSWDETSVVQNCRSRFFFGKPYTFAGNLMIAINPCRHLRSLHDSDLKVYCRVKRCLHVSRAGSSSIRLGPSFDDVWLLS